MTSINTLSSVGKSNVVTATPALPKTEANSMASPGSGDHLELTKTTVTLSEEATPDSTNPYDPQTGGINPNYRLTTLIRMSDEVQSNIYLKERKEYLIEPLFKADSALTRINTEIIKLQDKIEAIRPAILGKKWDFVLKDGKIEVTGNVNAKDKQWLENNLNRNKNVVAAAKDLYASVAKTYEHTADHPSASAHEGLTNKFAYGVAEQINGKIQLRSLMDQSVSKNTVRSVNPFIDAMELSKQYIKMSSESLYSFNMADMSDPETAAYMKANPNERL